MPFFVGDHVEFSEADFALVRLLSRMQPHMSDHVGQFRLREWAHFTVMHGAYPPSGLALSLHSPEQALLGRPNVRLGYLFLLRTVLLFLCIGIIQTL